MGGENLTLNGGCTFSHLLSGKNPVVVRFDKVEDCSPVVVCTLLRFPCTGVSLPVISFTFGCLVTIRTPLLYLPF